MAASVSPRDVLMAAADKLHGSAEPKQKMVFECAWEVCNKVGGIYTVIRTKLPQTVAALGDDSYCCLGPNNMDEAPAELEESEPEGVMKRTIDAMKAQGVVVRYGRWLVDGAPQVVLFDIGSGMARLAEWKKDLFDRVKIGCPWEDDEANRATVFGYLTSWFLGEYVHQAREERQVVAHFHEWQAGLGLVLTRIRKTNCATVFTTHATLLGRYLCADKDTDFYNNLPTFDVDKEAGDRGIYHRYCIERASVHSAHIFTTVSHITAYEAKYLLKRDVDFVTPNGLNVIKFSALHEFQNLHAKSKAKIHRFVQGHFHGHLDFDMDKTLYFFTAGRFEFINKGADVFLESLARLNTMLQQSGSDVTVIAFVIMPAATSNFNVDALGGQAAVKQMSDTVDEIQQKIGSKMLESLLGGTMPEVSHLLDATDTVQLKRTLLASKKQHLPPVTTHNLVDDANNDILKYIRRLHLFNEGSDRVKIVYHPEFLKPTSPLLPMDYEEFVRGCHLGVFPSYYEPWGYTPAECTVLGVPSVTSDLSGFGLFIREHVDTPSSYGIYVVDRRYKAPHESIQQLAENMYDFTQLNRRQRINLRNRTERLSDLLGWKTLENYYLQARLAALGHVFPEYEKFTKSDVSFQQRKSAANSPHLPRLHTNPAGDEVPPAQWEL
eukprot:m.13742 g.13742  ORF g.13742 m.13742 type:complete len:663 (-) comp5995_c0_seq1:1765-3753(-)